jgi:hypothetical protein
MGNIYMKAVYSRDGQVRLLKFSSFSSAQSFVAALIRVFATNDSDNVVYVMSNAVLPGTTDLDYTFHI